MFRFPGLAAVCVLTVMAASPAAEEVRQLTGFIEWILDSRFTVQERAVFEQAATASWSSMEGMAKLPAVLDALPAEKKAELRQQVQAGLLEQLRKTPNDAASKLLLTVYERGRVARPAAGSIPRELAGEWMSMHTSTVNYVDRATGAYAAPSGNGTQYKIFPDGRYQSASLIQSSMYNCTMTVNAFEEGVLRVDGGTMVFDSRGGTLDSKDNCNRGFNYTKKIPANQTVYSWRLERDEYGTKFCIVKPGVKEDCAYRK